MPARGWSVELVKLRVRKYSARPKDATGGWAFRMEAPARDGYAQFAREGGGGDEAWRSFS